MIEYSSKKSHENHSFLIGYGKFPYIILKAGYALYMQIPIHFNAYRDIDNHPGTHIDGLSDDEITNYKKNLTTKIHEKLIIHCQEIKSKIETSHQKPCQICLVEGPETAYYFEKDSICFNNSIPCGGTLITQQNKILAMNVDHYLL